MNSCELVMNYNVIMGSNCMKCFISFTCASERVKCPLSHYVVLASQSVCHLDSITRSQGTHNRFHEMDITFQIKKLPMALDVLLRACFSCSFYQHGSTNSWSCNNSNSQCNNKKKLLKGKIIILNIQGNIDKFNEITFNM